MKKLFLFFVCAASFVGANAQTKFGVKAGVNLADVVGKDAEDVKGKIGFHAGVQAAVPVSEKFSVKPELVFSLQGGKSDGGKVNLAYINLPILAQVSLFENFFAETGPQFGLLASAKAKSGDNKEDIKDMMKKLDFSWAFGVGYEFVEDFGVNLRYNLGLTKLYDEGDYKIKNGVFQLGVFKNF